MVKKKGKNGNGKKGQQNYVNSGNGSQNKDKSYQQGARPKQNGWSNGKGNSQNFDNSENPHKSYQCYTCHDFGHISRNCPMKKSKQAHFSCRNCGQNFGFSPNSQSYAKSWQPQTGAFQGKKNGASFQGQFGNLCPAHQAGSNWGSPNFVPLQARPAQIVPLDNHGHGFHQNSGVNGSYANSGVNYQGTGGPLNTQQSFPPQGSMNPFLTRSSLN